MEINGKLYGNNLQPIAGSFVVTDMQNNILFGDDTAADGSFAFNVAPGESRVVFSAPGYREGGIDVTGEESFYAVQLYPDVNYTPLILAAAVGVIWWYFGKKKKNRLGGFDIDKKDIISIFWLVGGVISFGLIKRLLESLGIWKSQDSKDLDNASMNPNSFWSPTYYLQFSSYSYAIYRTDAERWAREIYDAMGAFDDCEECVIGVIRNNIRTKANMSYLCAVFQDLYGQDLLTWLRGGFWPKDRLSDADVAVINNYVSKLPNN
jgi:hypothetical protein